MKTEHRVSSHSGIVHISPRLALALLVIALIVSANTINQYFVLDDFEMVACVKYNKLSHVLLGYDTVLENKFFRPIPMFAYWVVYELFGTHPAAYHAIAVLLHALCVVAAANLFYILFGDIKTAVVFGIVFAIFPNHTEVMNWPADFTSWAALFSLVSLTLFCYYRVSGRYAFFGGSLFAFVAAILSKESVLTLPFILILVDYILSRQRKIRVPYVRRAAEHSAYVGVLLGLLGLIRVFLQTGFGYRTVEGEDIVSLYLDNIYVFAVDIFGAYVQTWKYLFAPISPDVPLADVMISATVILLLVGCVALAWRRTIQRHALLFCFCFVMITALPILGTFRVLTLTHWSRYLYLPSFAGCYIIAMILAALSAQLGRPIVRFLFLGAIMLPIMALSKFYDSQWIEAQRESRKIMDVMVKEFRMLPPHSRVYVSGIPWTGKGIPRIDYALPAAVSLYFDKDRLQASLDFLPANKVLALEREAYSEDRWRYYWFNWDNQTKTVRQQRDIQPETAGYPIRLFWDLEKPSIRQYLVPAKDIRAVATTSSPPIFSTTGPWAFLWLPWVDSTRPIKYVTLNMMLKAADAKRDVARLFWVSEEEPQVTGGKSIGFFATTDGQFHEYKIPLYRNGLSLINPRIFRLAVRPSQMPGTLCSIRRVTIEYY
ncbi:MAG: hypothetical protein Kow0099_16780 [Candidatus Abyssubacteria bacterium]